MKYSSNIASAYFPCVLCSKLNDCRDHLVYILDVVGILMTAAYQEDLFTSRESIQEKFRSLSVPQVYKLVTSYAPDKYIPERISDKSQQSIRKLYDELPQDERAEEDLSFPTILALSNIQPVDFDIDDSDSDVSYEYSE